MDGRSPLKRCQFAVEFARQLPIDSMWCILFTDAVYPADFFLMNNNFTGIDSAACLLGLKDDI